MPRSIPPVTALLLVANVIIFGLQMLTGPRLELQFALWPPAQAQYAGFPYFQPWQIITYAFLHGSMQHLFFNMLALFMFGGDIERLLGGRRYTLYYFACVVGAAVAQLFVMTRMEGPPHATLGASGGVFGLLLAFGMAYPHRRILLIFPPIPLPAWLFVTLYGLLELTLGVTGTQDGVAHFAHLGGMAVGFVLLTHWRDWRRGAGSGG
jgi:membrane associated rhomboid family serine protease